MNEQLTVKVNAETVTAKKAINNFREAIENSKKEVEKAKKTLKESFKSIGESVKNGAAAAAKGFAAVSAAVVGVVKGTEEYRQNIAQLNASFEQSGFSAASAKDAYNQLYKVIGESDQAVESAANIAMLANSEKEAAKWAELASGVLGTFHDTLQPEAFYEAANETMKLGEATGAFTQMLEQTGVMSVEKFNEQLAACSTEAEKQALMLKVSQDAMGAAGESYNKSTANIQAQREAQAKLNETLAKVGEALSPVVTAFTNLANDALAKVTPHIQRIAEEYGPKLKDTLDATGEVVEKVIGWVKDNWGFISIVVDTIGIIVAGIVAYNAAMSIASTVSTIFGAAMTLLTSPIGVLVIAIGAVIAAGVALYKNWDAVTEHAKAAWNTIVTAFSNAGKNIINTLSKAKDAVKNTIDKIKGFFNFEWKLPKLKMPHVKISGEFSLVPPKVPKFSIDWYARGGVFDSPTLFNYGGTLGGLGEAGAEAIVPLENNLQWLDKMATMLSDKLGNNNTPIVLKVGETVFAQTIIDSLNKRTRQTGDLPLILV